MEYIPEKKNAGKQTLKTKKKKDSSFSWNIIS